MVKTVVIVMAMKAEAQPFIDHLDLQKDADRFHKGLRAECYSGTYKGETKVHLVLNGQCHKYGVDIVGTVGGAVTTFAAVQALSPDLVINAGTCGGFRAMGGEVGSIYLCTSFLNHDRWVLAPVEASADLITLRSSSAMTPLLPTRASDHAQTFPPDLVQEDSDPRLRRLWRGRAQHFRSQPGAPCPGGRAERRGEHRELARHDEGGRGLHQEAQGDVQGHGRWVLTPFISQCRPALDFRWSPSMIAMADPPPSPPPPNALLTGAAVAYMCDQLSVPMFALKSVTDIVDGEHPTPEEFLKNLGTAAKSLQQALPKVLSFIAEKPFQA